MSALVHVASVLEHLEAFEEEAFDLGLDPLAEKLSQARECLSANLSRVTSWAEKKEESRLRLKKAEEEAADFLGQSTMEMAFGLSEDDYCLLVTGRHLSVMNRLRYRCRKLGKLAKNTAAVSNFFHAHERVLEDHDGRVDEFLECSALHSRFKQEALWQSQQARPLLEAAKIQMLAQSDKSSEQHKRIKKRVVRTKRAAWMGEYSPFVNSIIQEPSA